MYLSCQGLRRKVKIHVLFEKDISEVQLSKLKNRVHITRDGNDLVVVSPSIGVELNGDFRMSIGLSKSEIANLALLAFGDESLDEFIDALASRRVGTRT